VVTALRTRPDDVNVIVTGRDCPPEIIEIADTVTEMRKIKHAYDQGITAKKGIEY
jgi:cob(I)alamin adenosyltransferase